MHFLVLEIIKTIVKMKHLNAWTMNSIKLAMFFFALGPVLAQQTKKEDCREAIIRTGTIVTRVKVGFGRFIPKRPRLNGIYSDALSAIETKIQAIGFPGPSSFWEMDQQKAADILKVIDQGVSSIKSISSEPSLTSDELYRIKTLKSKMGEILNFFLNDRSDLIERGSELNSQFESIYQRFYNLPSLQIAD